MANELPKSPTTDFVSTTLNGSINDSTTSITVNDASNINYPCYAVIDREDVNGNATATLREVVYITGISSNTLTVTRGASGSTKRSHNDSAKVEPNLTVGMWDDMYDIIDVEHSTTDGTHDATKVAMLAGNQTITGTKTFGSGLLVATSAALTTPVLTTSVSGTAFLDEDDMASNSATKLASQQSIKAYVDANGAPADGWISAGAMTYASASTVTVAAGAAALYAVGDRVKFTQTTVKYFVITGVADTVLTFAVNTDYTVANAAITLPYYSHQVNPVGFPDWFTVVAPTFDVASIDNGSGGQPTTTYHRMKIVGRQVTVHYQGSGTKQTSDAGWTFNLNIYPTFANVTDFAVIGSAMGIVNGVYTTMTPMWKSATLCYVFAGVNFTDGHTITSWGYILNYEI